MNILNGYSAKKRADALQQGENFKQMTTSKGGFMQAVNSECDEVEEKFIPPPMDTFNDLFEHGKLSEMILGKRLMFMPFLPSKSIIQSEKKRLSILNSLDDSEWNQQLDQWKESIINDVQVESRDLCSDMPKIEDLAFKIPDNFDLI